MENDAGILEKLILAYDESIRRKRYLYGRDGGSGACNEGGPYTYPGFVFVRRTRNVTEIIKTEAGIPLL